MSEIDLDARRKGPAPSLSPDQRAEVRERYSKGATEDHLAEVFGVSRSTINRTLAGAAKRPVGRRANPLVVARVADLDKQGRSAIQIAEELDIPRSTARYHLRKLRGVSDAK